MGLLRASKDEDLVKGLRVNVRKVKVSPARRALLDYVIRLTMEPWAVTEKDVRAMRENGYSDQAISAANQITGFFAWCNRTVDGLGVPMEDYWPEDVRAREAEVKRTSIAWEE